MLQGLDCDLVLSVQRYLELRVFGLLLGSLFTTLLSLRSYRVPRTNSSGISFALALSAL